jgi:hypothetical protein
MGGESCVELRRARIVRPVGEQNPVRPDPARNPNVHAREESHPERAALSPGVPVLAHVAQAHPPGGRQVAAVGLQGGGGGRADARGTDPGVGPHCRSLEWSALMAAGGMKPAAVLAATTSSAAGLLGLADTTGTIAPASGPTQVVVDRAPYDFTGLKT